MTTKLTGCAWGHTRGFSPMVETAATYHDRHPSVEILWEQRSLQAFADQPMTELATHYDFIVIDHPHVGEVAAEGSLIPLDEVVPADVLAEQRSQSVGPSFPSYEWNGHQWALATDVAAQVSAWRPDLVPAPPQTWDDVVDLAEQGKVLWPLKPVDAVSSFFTLCANLGSPVAANEKHLTTDRHAHAVLDLMERVTRHTPAECLQLNPIEVLDWLSADQEQFAYAPLLYGYSNYARPGHYPSLVRFANIPDAGGHGSRGSMLGGAGLAISSRCADVEAAVGYLLHVADSETQRTTYFEAGGQPGNAVAWDDDAVNAASSNFFRDTRTTLEQSWVRPRYSGFLEVQARVGELMNGVLRGAVERGDALREANEVFLRTLAASDDATQSSGESS